MRRLRSILMVALALASAMGHAQSDLDTTPGLQASRAWLADMDDYRYGDTYENAAPELKAGMTKAQWETGLVRNRGPLGIVVARKIRLASCTRGTRADPEAEICVIQYDTQFEKRLGDEQVTALRGRDGTWRVAAYSLR